jgi:hypothetical protein
MSKSTLVDGDGFMVKRMTRIKTRIQLRKRNTAADADKADAGSDYFPPPWFVTYAAGLSAPDLRALCDRLDKAGIDSSALVDAIDADPAQDKPNSGAALDEKTAKQMSRAFRDAPRPASVTWKGNKAICSHVARK